MPTPARPRIGLIGCGLWGANILRDLRALGVPTVVVDISAVARERALRNGAAAVLSEPTTTAAVDGWIIATPASSHSHAIAAIAGQALPILCEKPLATSLTEVASIAALLRAPLHVMDVWRYHPAVERMQLVVAEGELGQVHGLCSIRASWTSPRVDVDTVWNLAPHEISIYRQIFGTFPEPVSAFAECLDGHARSLWSRWGGQPWLLSELSNRHPKLRRELRLHCERGVALFNSDAPGVLEIASGAADERLQAADPRVVQLAPESALQRQLADWLGFLAGGNPPRSDLEHATRVTVLLEWVRTLAGLDQ